jgi:hypothetical protein
LFFRPYVMPWSQMLHSFPASGSTGQSATKAAKSGTVAALINRLNFRSSSVMCICRTAPETLKRCCNASILSNTLQKPVSATECGESSPGRGNRSGGAAGGEGKIVRRAGDRAGDHVRLGEPVVRALCGGDAGAGEARLKRSLPPVKKKYEEQTGFLHPEQSTMCALACR